MPYAGYKDKNVEGSYFAPGAIGGSPQRQDISPSVANILCMPFNGDYIDKTGNHTMAPRDSTMTPNIGYNGESQVFIERGSNDSLRTGAGEPAHAIGGTDPVTFGFFFRPTYLASVQYFCCSSRNDGSGFCNYGLRRVGGDAGTWYFIGGAGIGASTTLVDPGYIDDRGIHWLHVAFRCDSGANTGAFFINGTKLWEGAIAARKTAEASDLFNLNEVSSTTNNPQVEGYIGNLFVTDSALSDTNIKLLSDQSFGHASPYVAGGI